MEIFYLHLNKERKINPPVLYFFFLSFNLQFLLKHKKNPVNNCLGYYIEKQICTVHLQKTVLSYLQQMEAFLGTKQVGNRKK